MSVSVVNNFGGEIRNEKLFVKIFIFFSILMDVIMMWQKPKDTVNNVCKSESATVAFLLPQHELAQFSLMAGQVSRSRCRTCVKSRPSFFFLY